MSELLRVSRLRKVYGGLVAIDDVSFSVGEHEVVGVMGANGAGKTTLFNLISGAARPGSGEIHFRGQRIDGMRPAKICNQGVGRTYQIVKPFAGMTVFENVMVGFLYGSKRPKSSDSLQEKVDQLLVELDLHGQRNRMAGELTLAGRKRLEVARALATRPDLLMLDEVLAGLTPTESIEAQEMLHRLHRQRGLTMLIVEHNLRAMMQLCKRIVVLHHGVKIGEGSPDSIIRNEEVVSAYLGPAK